MTKYHAITIKQYGDQHCEDPSTHLELVPLERAIANLGYVHIESVAMLEERKKNRSPCLNCGSASYASCWWRLSDGEVSYCSDCSPDTPPPPKPLLKFLACPGCNRMLGTLSEHLPPGRCCLCGAELSPPVCPHCGNDTFHQTVPSNFITFKADGTLALPSLYFFQCARCGKEVGTLPLKRTDK